MTRRGLTLVAASLTALALASAAATCRSGETAEPGERAVPAKVELDWPDAAPPGHAMTPPPRHGGDPAPEPDAGA